LNNEKRRRSESKLARQLYSIREKLDRLSDLFAWLYDKTEEPTAIRRKLLPVLFRLTEGEIRRLDADSLTRFENSTRKWDLKHFRARVRKGVEGLIERAQKGGSQPLPSCTRSVIPWESQGESLFGIGLRFPGRGRFAGLDDVVIVEAAEDLAGLRLDAVVRCPMCNALTLRQRAKVKKYCSSACRWRAISEERRKRGAPLRQAGDIERPRARRARRVEVQK
jgi:hypothetical protein